MRSFQTICTIQFLPTAPYTETASCLGRRISSFFTLIFFLSWFMVFKLSLNVIWITEQLEMCQYIFFSVYSFPLTLYIFFFFSRAWIAVIFLRSFFFSRYLFGARRFIRENMLYIGTLCVRGREHIKNSPFGSRSFQWFRIQFLVKS